MIEYVLIDLDGTIIDFNASEKVAVAQTVLELAGYNLNESEILIFNEINERLFNEFARGEMPRIVFQEARFKELSEIINIDIDSSVANKRFLHNLKFRGDIYPDVIEALEYLSTKYKLMIASNGMMDVQTKRLEAGNVLKYFDRVYVSSVIGYNKPEIEFFDYIFKDLNDFDSNKYVIIGDRLQTDIQGGINANMKTILVNRNNLTINEISPDYIVNSFEEIKGIL